MKKNGIAYGIITAACCACTGALCLMANNTAAIGMALLGLPCFFGAMAVIAVECGEHQ